MAATESNPVIFYDFKTKAIPYIYWSPNTWKTRLTLNYKGIPYKTVYLSYPEIAPTLSSKGFPAPPPGGKYTLPAIEAPQKDDLPTPVADSYDIAMFLEATYPDTPPLFPKGSEALQELFIHHFTTRIGAISGKLLIPPVVDIIDEASVDYFRTTREKMFGKSLEEALVKGEERETNLKKLEEEYHLVASLTSKNVGGALYLGGSKPIYADFIMLGHLLWMRVVLPPDDWQRVMQWQGGHWQRVLDASKDIIKD